MNVWQCQAAKKGKGESTGKGAGADRAGAKRAAAEAAQVAAAKRQKLASAAAASGIFGSGRLTKKDQKFVEDVAKVMEKVVAKVEKGVEAEVRRAFALAMLDVLALGSAAPSASECVRGHGYCAC